MKDLILLVADKSMERTLLGGLARPQSLGIRPITLDFRQHPGRDASTLLQLFLASPSVQ